MDLILRFALATLTALEFHWFRFWREYVALLLALVVIVGGGWFFFVSAPWSYPADVTVVIPQGAALREVAEVLKNASLIRSELAFEVLVRGAGEADSLSAGRYRFHERQSALQIARRLINADSGIPPVRITIPEGSSNKAIAEFVHTAFPDITTTNFLTAVKGQQGYLFPDTYDFTPDTTLADIVTKLRGTFDKRLESIGASIIASRYNIHDIVIMASIVEGETNTAADRRLVAGILWKRLDIGMALQVDVAPDTYKTKGLPPEAINNPGLDAILAAALPTKSSYLYYLTGKDGKMHYAKTFAEHQANVTKYL